jgi:hypothetical protein
MVWLTVAAPPYLQQRELRARWRRLTAAAVSHNRVEARHQLVLVLQPRVACRVQPVQQVVGPRQEGLQVQQQLSR